MKNIKYLVLGLVCSILLAGAGVDAASYVEHTVIGIEVPGMKGTATVSGEEYHEGGKQYVKTTNTIDKVNSKTRAASARVHQTLHPAKYSTWVSVPNGEGYKELGDLDLNYYELQLKENTWSALGFYWYGNWKINQ